MGLSDDNLVTLSAIAFAVFALVVLNQTIGVILLAYGVAYAIALNAKGRYHAIQWSSRNADRARDIGYAAGGFIAFYIASSVILGWLNLGSSIQLYSTALQPIFTIDHPVIRLFVWGILIPFLETVFFLGMAGLLITKRLGHRGFNVKSANFWVVCLAVAAIAASFHILSQFLNQGALLMDMLLFGMGMAIVFKTGELKQAGYMHMIVNSVAMLYILGYIGGAI